MIKRGLSDKVIDQVCKEERNNSKNEIKQEKVEPIKPKINSTKECIKIHNFKLNLLI